MRPDRRDVSRAAAPNARNAGAFSSRPFRCASMKRNGPAVISAVRTSDGGEVFLSYDAPVTDRLFGPADDGTARLFGEVNREPGEVNGGEVNRGGDHFARPSPVQ